MAGEWGMPEGFIFEPTDEQLVSRYLRGRVAGGPAGDGLIAEFDVHGCDPWGLPRRLFEYPRGQLDEMYFFGPRHSVDAKGRRCGRAAGCGVWRGDGEEDPISAWDDAAGRRVVVGHKTSFRFERIKPLRIKTGWLMHEYRLGPGGIDGCRGLVLYKIYEKRCEEQVQGDDEQPQRQLKRRRVDAEQHADSIGEVGRPDPAKRGRFEQPEEQQHQPFDNATPQSSSSSSSSCDALFPLEDMDADSWPDDAFTLEDIDALSLLPPLDSEPPPSSPSAPLMTDDSPWQFWLGLDRSEGSPPLHDILQQDVSSDSE